MSYSTCTVCGSMLEGYPGSACTNTACGAYESDPAKRRIARQKAEREHRHEQRRRRRADDPRSAGGSMFDAGGPHSRGTVMFDSRRAVLVEEIETAVAHRTRAGQPVEDAVALVIHGRINRPPDDEIASARPAEQVQHLHMLSWDAVADLICDLQSLAKRDGFDLVPLLEQKWAEAEARGLTRRAA